MIGFAFYRLITASHRGSIPGPSLRLGPAVILARDLSPSGPFSSHFLHSTFFSISAFPLPFPPSLPPNYIPAAKQPLKCS